MSIQTKIKTDVVTELVTLEQAKDWCRIEGTDEDTLITSMIKASRLAAENWCNSSFAQKTLYCQVDDIAERDNQFLLPYPPHRAVTTVWEVDEEGTETELTLNSGYYKTGLTEFNILINSVVPAVGIVGGTFRNQIKVEYTVGFETGFVPQDVILAMKRILVTNWEFREDWVIGKGISLVPDDAKAILNRKYNYYAI
jgi:uncharacterized phiE125 gp8 family phage protein